MRACEHFTCRPRCNMIKRSVSHVQLSAIMASGLSGNGVTYGGDRLLLLMPPVQLLQLMRLLFSLLDICVWPFHYHTPFDTVLSHTHTLAKTPRKSENISFMHPLGLRDIIQALNLYLPVSKLNLKHFLFIPCVIGAHSTHWMRSLCVWSSEEH